MFAVVNNEKGNVGIAIVVIIVAVMSGVSMASQAFRDTNALTLQFDGLQQFHFIRSEVGRGRLLITYFESLESPPLQSVLPTRLIRVEFGRFRTLFQAKTKIETVQGIYDTGYSINSLISAIRGLASTTNPDIISPVRRYAENKIRSLQTLAIFHYFSDIDREKDDVAGNIRFFSGDVIHGRVHSNTDIWITGTPWPTFHGLVSTAGTIRVHAGGQYPRDDVFRGGLIENYRRISFNANADLVRRGDWVPRTGEDNQLAFVTVNGSSYTMYIGTVTERDMKDKYIEGINHFTVYDSYPPYGVVGEEIGVNIIPVLDTIWTGPYTGSNRSSIFVPMELWISGNFGGRQTWASSHDIYLKDDLTYVGTPIGHYPDGGPEGQHQVNRSDFLGIISEGSIYIQYGYRDPVDSRRHRPNTEDIYMYGAYCAVGQGDNPWEDGVFTFQYQFPKGSTPPQMVDGEPFQKIDLYRFSYPTTSTEPWPLGLDYPWYNPLWPEPGEIYGFPGFTRTPNPHNANDIVKLRGDIYLFGSIAQRRRGFVRRSGNSDFDTGLWDIENIIRPNTPPQYGAPPPSIGPTGYNKRYAYDTRFDRVSPPRFPLIKFEGFETDDLMDLGHLTMYWEFKKPPSNF